MNRDLWVALTGALCFPCGLEAVFPPTLPSLSRPFGHFTDLISQKMMLNVHGDRENTPGLCPRHPQTKGDIALCEGEGWDGSLDKGAYCQA